MPPKIVGCFNLANVPSNTSRKKEMHINIAAEIIKGSSKTNIRLKKIDKALKKPINKAITVI
ncbi:unnamed protein product [marine sediment metagenome]|uniref:Uncharacterized protein n=1 Tax=marine sediment metagenome TaxID=412755 RepID=X1GRB0_9ZZZZ